MSRYNLKEYWWHREAASVNLNVVKREQLRVAEILKKYPPKDCLNLDESELVQMVFPIEIYVEKCVITNSSAAGGTASSEPQAAEF